MKIEKNNRGFGHIQFTDRYGAKCSLQKSSLATEDAIWFGVNDADPQIMASKVMQNDEKGVGWVKYPIHPDVVLNTKMHLTQDQVTELLPTLIRFAETGSINE
jgi:hypothetical protein